MFNTVKAFFTSNKIVQPATKEEVKVEVIPPKKTVWDLKKELKELALEIRELKTHRPQSNRGKWTIGELDCTIRSKGWIFRHKHIAYCLIRGTAYEEIERKCGKDNQPYFTLVDKIIKEYTYA